MSAVRLSAGRAAEIADSGHRRTVYGPQIADMLTSMTTPSPQPAAPSPRSPAVWLATGLALASSRRHRERSARIVGLAAGMGGRPAAGRRLAGAGDRCADLRSAFRYARRPAGRWAARRTIRRSSGTKSSPCRSCSCSCRSPIGRSPLAGFLLHRLFDITKPPPARQLERLPDGLGVMADDVMASVYACLALAGTGVARSSGWVG